MNDTLQILEKVNAFYSGAFAQLVTITIAIVAVSGVMLPILIQIIQSRTFRNEQKALEAKIDNEVSEKGTQLQTVVEEKFAAAKAEFDEALMKATADLKQKLSEQIVVARAGTFHIQAASEFEKQQLAFAARDFAIAGKMYFQGNDEMNGHRTLRALIDECLPTLSANDLETVPQVERETTKLVKLLRERNKRGAFEDSINNIEAHILRIKKTPAPAGPASPPKKIA